MSLLPKFKTISYCVGGKHYCDNNNIRGLFTVEGINMIKVNCVNCN